MSGFWGGARQVWAGHPVRHTLVGLWLLSFLGYGLYNYYGLGGRLRQQHRYTAATITGTHWSRKSGRFADARYTVRGRAYRVSADADRLAGQPLAGRRFLVEYHPPDPAISVLHLLAPLPDTLAAPPAGWLTPPVPLQPASD